VFDSEPLRKDSPLWENPKVTITPHIAALTTPEMILSVFAENLELYEQGKELKYQVDWEKGY
jgi:phosphoglycerate dehydrogenase-like enzyme